MLGGGRRQIRHNLDARLFGWRNSSVQPAVLNRLVANHAMPASPYVKSHPTGEFSGCFHKLSFC
jgi:hypothetical protein